MNISLITPSYGPDFERCRVLCESVESFVSGHNKHVVIVDHQDYDLFKCLNSGKTEIVIKEDFLPTWLHKIPMTKKWWFSFKTLPVRGWILQQIVKLSAAEILDDELFLFVDSDVAFIKPFDVNSVIHNDQVRLYSQARKTQDYFDRRKQNWHLKSANWFGINDPSILTQDYISQLVVWRHDTLQKLLNFIEESKQRAWKEVLCGSLDFSEYTLYGIFAERVLQGQSGHYLTKDELCYCSWHHEIDNTEDLKHFLTTIPEDYSSVLIQSNLKISPQSYLKQIQLVQEKVKPKLRTKQYER